MERFKNREKLSNELNIKRKTVIIGHSNPDGDCIGSVTALSSFLRTRGLDPVIILPDDPPEFLQFLTEGHKLLSCFSRREECFAAVADCELLICLDHNKFSRAGDLEHHLSACKAEKVMIDHHLFPDEDAFDIVISKTEISSACELLYQVLLEMPEIDGDVTRLPLECRESLYSGMMTDTNNFNNSVFPTTFAMASELLKAGVDIPKLHDNILCSYSERRMRLMGRMLESRMRVMEKCPVAYMTLPMEVKDEFGFKPGDGEGFVNLPLSIKGIKMTALFTEKENGTVRVSLRSKGDTDVNSFAKAFFNGGGHKNASGGKLDIPISEVADYFEKAVDEYFLQKGHIFC